MNVELTTDHLRGFGIALIFAFAMAAAAHTGPTEYDFSYDYDLPGARVCYYNNGNREFRLTVRSGVACPIEVRLK